ncbi:hypothetical protein [Streptomyces hygroscopicus]|uniref:hypothetical protein n=1 Tax=Streptomyces hygroscopicus TaxID=1912 RepID=UPI00223F09E2|nr:hypothetical protein [Streptomyces hygroscopicus]
MATPASSAPAHLPSTTSRELLRVRPTPLTGDEVQRLRGLRSAVCGLRARLHDRA